MGCKKAQRCIDILKICSGNVLGLMLNVLKSIRGVREVVFVPVGIVLISFSFVLEYNRLSVTFNVEVILFCHDLSPRYSL